MQYLSDSGFVIKRVNFGEADRYISLFTKNHGKIEVIAKGVRKITSRRSSHIELLNLINFQAVKTSKNFILTEVQLVDSFEHRKRDLSNISMLFLICELIEKLCPPGQVHEDIFGLIQRTIQFSPIISTSTRGEIPLSTANSNGISVPADRQGYPLHRVRNDNVSPSSLRGEDQTEGERNSVFNFQTELLALLGFWDQSKKFRDEADLRQFIENILERKIKTKIYS